MIKFVVIESNRFKKSKHYARIHRASCGHAKEPNQETASTVWHGYFDTYLEALRFAKSLDVEEVHECTFCEPGSTSITTTVIVKRSRKLYSTLD